MLTQSWLEKSERAVTSATAIAVTGDLGDVPTLEAGDGQLVLRRQPRPIGGSDCGSAVGRPPVISAMATSHGSEYGTLTTITSFHSTAPASRHDHRLLPAMLARVGEHAAPLADECPAHNPPVWSRKLRICAHMLPKRVGKISVMLGPSGRDDPAELSGQTATTAMLSPHRAPSASR